MAARARTSTFIRCARGLLAVALLLTAFGLTTEATAQSAKFEQFTVTSPKAGDTAPDFTLMTLEGEPFNLMEVAAEKPVVIEFGSFT